MMMMMSKQHRQYAVHSLHESTRAIAQQLAALPYACTHKGIVIIAKEKKNSHPQTETNVVLHSPVGRGQCLLHVLATTSCSSAQRDGKTMFPHVLIQ
jgi:hypothetical protein